ncbi:hypothetical protein [Flavobacterium sp. N1736]|nr:hypothetical protein [Flavobacterium sp. N1736]
MSTNLQSAPIALVSPKSPPAPAVPIIAYLLSCPIAGYSASLEGT